MSARRWLRSKGAKTRRVEWIGGILALPTYVTGEGEPYRPEALLWMSEEGAVLGYTSGKGELLATAADSLAATAESPLYGKPHRPTRVRVASAELADALRAGHPGLDVVCAPTPELDGLFAHMQEHLGDGDSPAVQSYLSPEITPDAMRAFFKAAAALFRSRPWTWVPADDTLFSVTVEQFGVHDRALSVIGQMGQSLGLVLFESLDDFEAYIDAVELLETHEAPTMPPQFVVNFDRGAELPPQLRREISEHGWEVAGANAYPWVCIVDEDLVARPPTAKELALAEALALALVEAANAKNRLQRAWRGRGSFSRTLAIATHSGTVDVTLRAPYQREPIDPDQCTGLLRELAVMASDMEQFDDARRALEAKLLQDFAASPEAEAIDPAGTCGMAMDLAAAHLGHTIATLGVHELRELLFDIIPRKVSVPASEAQSMVQELRAFYAYLKRVFGLAQADACLRVLGDNAVRKLESALSDRSGFGLAKSLVMAGADAGFDVESEEGLVEWLESIQGQPLPPSISLPGLPAPPRSAQKPAKAKKKRKAARKARKRNRK